MRHYTACGRCRVWGDHERRTDQHGLVCDGCYELMFDDAEMRLKASQARPSAIPEIGQTVRADAARLGHDLGDWWPHAEYAETRCRNCMDYVRVDWVRTFGKERTRGPALMLRCRGSK